MKRAYCLAVLALLGGVGCKGASAGGPTKTTTSTAPPVKVELGEVVVQKMPRYLTLTGSVLADRQSEVAANVMGRVISTNVERGQPVKRGDILAIVDSKNASLQASAAASQSQAADTQVGLAKQECDRATALFAQGAIAQVELDRMTAQCRAQLFSANAARANASLAAKLAGDSVIRAPIDGTVGERYVNVGEYVQPMTRIASLFAIDPVRVLISVPESAVSLVRDGQTLDLRVSAYAGRSFPATVTHVSPALRPQTRDLMVEAVAKNSDAALRPGMFATIKLLTGEEELATVPDAAIRADGTLRRIWLAKDGAAHEVVVRTGVSKDGRTAIYEELASGVAVVLKPPTTLRDGAALAN